MLERILIVLSETTNLIAQSGVLAQTTHALTALFVVEQTTPIREAEPFQLRPTLLVLALLEVLEEVTDQAEAAEEVVVDVVEVNNKLILR